jgi:phage terminase large subunit
LSTLRIPTAKCFLPLLQPARYLGAHGGRGSGKSHFFAEKLVERCLVEETRAVCVREVQKSLEQSVKRTIEDKIAHHNVGSYFRILNDKIEAPYGGLIIFQGMQNHTAESIKSLEGYDIAWVEEAQSISEKSLRLLRPTIRKPESELWFSWNPVSPEDPIDKLLRGENRIKKNAIVVEANWRDNPWLNDVLRDEMETDRERDQDSFEHVWGGGYQVISESIIFRNRVSIEAFETPPDARFFFGVDWGFANDPTAIIRCFIKDECLYIDYEAGGVGIEIDETPQLLDMVPGSRSWPIKADCARPETISYMRRQGFAIEGADKWPGSVEDGIAHLKGFKRIIIHERCPRTAQETRRYSYKVDRITGDILPIIVDAWNHYIDSIRYALSGFIQKRGVNNIWARLAK